MRVFRMIATPLILLGLLGFLVWGGLWGWRNLTAPLPEPEPTPCVTVPWENVWPDNVLVNVYNGGYTRGLAERAATHLRDHNFYVGRTSNTDEAVRGTIVRGAESSQKGMELVASHFLEVTMDYDDRVDGTIDLLVGSEFAGYSDEPWPNIPLEGEKWCKPAELESPSPSPSATATGAGESAPAEGGEPAQGGQEPTTGTEGEG